MSKLILYRGAVYKEAYAFSDEANAYLYHCTEYFNLEDIARQGLRPNRHSNSAGESGLYLTEPGGLVEWIGWVKYSGPHRLPKFFEMEQAHETDAAAPNPYELIRPVVLRTKILSDVALDRCGTDDARMCLLSKLDNYLPAGTVPPREQPMAPAVDGEDLNTRLTRRYKDSKRWEREQAKLVQELEQQARAYRVTQAIPVKELELWDGTGWTPVGNWNQVDVPETFRPLLASLTSGVKVDPVTLQRSTADARVASGSRVLYHVGKRPPKPYPLDKYQDLEADFLSKRQYYPESGVFLTSDPIKVQFLDGVTGNVYALEVPEWVIAESGGMHRISTIDELVVPEHLWRHVKLLGRAPKFEHPAKELFRSESLDSVVAPTNTRGREFEQGKPIS